MRHTLTMGTTACLPTFAAGSTAWVRVQTPDAESVRAAAPPFYAALNAHDIRAIETLWAQDASPVMIHPSGPRARAPAIGWEVVRQRFAEAWPYFAEWSVRVGDMRVRVGQGRAVVLAATPVHVKMEGSDRARNHTDLATVVYERRDGPWLSVHQHVSQPSR